MKFVQDRQKTTGRSRRIRLIGWLTAPVIVLLVGFVVINPLAALSGFLRPVAVFSQIVGSHKLLSTDNRTNVLVLGLDKRTPAERGLSDTIMVVSVEIKKNEAVFFSIPRDVWVKSYRAKVNALYALGGAELTRKVIGEILDLPIHYYVVVDFSGFEKAVDAVSGIKVNVEREFEDFRYPLPGREDDDCGGQDPEFRCRYEYIVFNKGWQEMDGKTALKFSRSRQSTGPEGSDFARAGRQQKVMMALKDKILSLPTLVNPSTLTELYRNYRSSVETSVGLFEAERFFDISQKVKDENVRSLVVNKGSTGEDLLYTPADFTPYDGQWVLLPRAGDFTEVHALIQKTLFGER